MPPPRVSPPTPVVEMKPLGTARPKGWVAWSTSPQRHPPSTRTVFVLLVDPDALHPREVDHEAPVADAEARAVVAAAAHRQEQLLLAGEVHAGDHVRHVDAPGDQRGLLVDHAVVDLAGRVVAPRRSG